MNWHQSPELLDRLAAEYALGTLHGGARRRFEAVLQAHPDVARAAARWQERLAPMDADLPPLPADDVLWARIEQRAFGGGVAAADARPQADVRQGRGGPSIGESLGKSVQRWWQRWLAPIPAGALALGLLLGLVGPGLWPLLQGERDESQLPESYIGVLSAADGRQGLIVSSLRRGRTVDLKQVQPAVVPAGQTLFLWTLDAQGVAQPVGPIPSGAFTHVPLDRVADEVFARAVELGVTLEPAGSRPTQPTVPYVYRGLCGKMWRVVPAPASAPTR
jgi:anti-sigma-K factor RskA